MISHASLHRVLRAEVSFPGGQKAAAKRLGVSAQYLNDVLNGRREFGHAILQGLGYRRVVMYKRDTNARRSDGRR